MGWELNASLRILSTPQRTSLWCLHRKEGREEEVWENGISLCVCGGEGKWFIGFQWAGERLRGDNDCLQESEHLLVSICTLNCSLTDYKKGRGAATKKDIHIISHTHIYNKTYYTSTVKCIIECSLFTETV